ncbi:hypothetical protein N657DRAFT_656402 [Parathielavia appendiculata]|uniref:Uncharacterized protein n=1 Tax=Parathielavia appendiculata TaxID=2587402 RepID=A0AAN6TYP8_9PEZI|nr:hypothetical protein N657DRAFT_656402 [Parathielavia appendiculata]
MAGHGTARTDSTEEAPAVIEILSSDSEPEVPEEEPEAEDNVSEPGPDNEDDYEQPLSRAASIKYKIEETQEEEPPQDEHRTPSGAKLAMRARDTESAKHRHVSIEIPLPTSSELRRRKAESETSGSQEGNGEDVLKTSSERRRITFDDSDHDEFVTPKEGPSRDSLDTSVARPDGEAAGQDGGEEEEEAEEAEESDDDAPPEAVSTRTAEAEALKATEAERRAAQQQSELLKRKNQERTALLQKQAAERKRARESTQLDEEDEATSSPAELASETEKGKREVPKFLPLELLESDDEDDIVQQPSSSTDGKHKRRKLGGPEQALLREPRLPKDKRLGSTAYRVVKGTGDPRLAPRVKKQAISLRETLLRRDRVAKPRGEFFVKNR